MPPRLAKRHFCTPPGWRWLMAGLLVWLIAACSEQPWNSPYPDETSTEVVLHEAFADRPKHLDPVSSYSSDEVIFVAQVYEPPLQYAFFSRPYQLIPLTLTRLPSVSYVDTAGKPLPSDAAAESVAFTHYDLEIQAGIQFQPHPAFAMDETGAPRYLRLDRQRIAGLRSPYDLPHQGSRELTAEDYVYQVKRLAHPRLHSPLFAFMAQYVLGLDELSQRLRALPANQPIDLKREVLEGVQALDRYRYRITIKGKYPQFIYWLAMPFFAPMAWEVEAFYAQAGMAERNLSLDWWPVGTGPYQLVENNPNRRMVLQRNPLFRGEPFPTSRDPQFTTPEWQASFGQAMPFVDRAIYSLEPEAIPTWHKFLQGYYDRAAIPRDSFEQVVQYDAAGGVRLSPAMQAQGLSLVTAVEPSLAYTGFNFLDPVVGGLSERARKLRQAISVALDMEEFISIFRNGRGVVAHGPIPPGIAGHRSGVTGFNPVTHTLVDGAVKRRPLSDARQLLQEAGYANGIDPATQRPLSLFLDAVAAGPEAQPVFDWHRKQFQQLGIELVVRQTDYNRFQEKMRGGQAQLFQWGWNADYPDPENFLFLLHGPQAKVGPAGENAANYQNPAFDALFEQIKTLEDGSERNALLEQAVDLLREDAPWVFGLHPVAFGLYHQWYGNALPHPMANNVLKYRRIDPLARARRIREWNQARGITTAVIGLALGSFSFVVLALRRRSQRRGPST